MIGGGLGLATGADNRGGSAEHWGCHCVWWFSCNQEYFSAGKFLQGKMANKPLEKSKNEWRDMDQFGRNVLSGEYSSSSDNLGYALPPIHEENNLEEEALASAPEETNDPTNAATEQGKARGSSYFNLNLPTISEEQPEGVAFVEALPSGEELGEAEPSESKDSEDLFPFPLDICLLLEQRCMISKQMFSKYVSDKERREIENIYNTTTSSAKVSGSAATLHLCTKNHIWMEQFYGVPVVVVDYQEPVSKLWIYLAERDSGLPLWRETVCWQSAYTRETSTYHVMYVANSRCEKMGLNFDCETAATDFWVHVSRLTAQLESLGAAPPQPIPSTSSMDSLRPDDCDHFPSLQCCLCGDDNVEEQDENGNIIPE